jgi:hypothetical protein
LTEELKQKYAEIAEYVKSFCLKLRCLPRNAERLGLCCNNTMCLTTVQDAEIFEGVKLELPEGETFIEGSECSVPPHIRRLCSVHACDRLQLFAPGFMEKYLKLRNEICELEVLDDQET